MENKYDVKVRQNQILNSTENSTEIKQGWYIDLVKYNIEDDYQYEVNRITVATTINEDEIQNIIEEVTYIAINAIALERFVNPSTVRKMFIKH